MPRPPRPAPRVSALLAATSALALPPLSARAQGTLAATPPPEAKALVDAPKDQAAPTIPGTLDGTTAGASIGGLWASGNAKLIAISANGAYETRWQNNGIGASLLGNYGQSAAAGQAVQVTAENVQGRVRYDRFVVDELAFFVINTARHDRFQGLDLRYNLDPGAKYLFIPQAARALWAELGYDLQHDVRRDADRAVVATPGQAELLAKTVTSHAVRAFIGHKRRFNDEVTLTLGLEYLQTLTESTRYRVNLDTLFAAKVGGGLALGVGFGARYDHSPLPGKEDLDTSTTLSLVYAFSDVSDR
jgi:hypothetical protein